MKMLYENNFNQNKSEDDTHLDPTQEDHTTRDWREIWVPKVHKSAKKFLDRHAENFFRANFERFGIDSERSAHFARGANSFLLEQGERIMRGEYDDFFSSTLDQFKNSFFKWFTNIIYV